MKHCMSSAQRLEATAEMPSKPVTLVVWNSRSSSSLLIPCKSNGSITSLFLPKEITRSCSVQFLLKSKISMQSKNLSSAIATHRGQRHCHGTFKKDDIILRHYFERNTGAKFGETAIWGYERLLIWATVHYSTAVCTKYFVQGNQEKYINLRYSVTLGEVARGHVLFLQLNVKCGLCTGAERGRRR